MEKIHENVLVFSVFRVNFKHENKNMLVSM